ncbi:hypothetical protein ES705_23318 [subsurface metagenome]
MKKITLLFIATLMISTAAFSQGDLDKQFYFRMGYSKPTMKYWGIDNDNFWNDVKRNGFVFELGQIFMLNSIPLADGLRLGINADYLSFYYHGIKSDFITVGNIILGSKVGPSISYSPVDKLVFDAYGKFNPVWFGSVIMVPEGTNTDSEIFLGALGIGYSLGINVRYSILMLGFDFNKSFTKLQYYDESEGLVDDSYFGNMGTDSGDADKDRTPLSSMNFTIGLSF